MALNLGELTLDIGADTSDLAKAEKEVARINKRIERSTERREVADQKLSERTLIAKENSATRVAIANEKSSQRSAIASEKESQRKVIAAEKASERGIIASEKLSTKDRAAKIRAANVAEREAKRAATIAERESKKTAVAAEKAAKKAEKAAKKAGSAVERQFKKVGLAIGAAISIALARRVILIADNMQVLERRLVRFTGSTEKAEKTFRRLADTASDTGSEIKSTVQIFERFSLIRKELGATNEQILVMTDTLAKLGAIGGSSQEEISNSLRQLTQGLAGGTLRAEEFNSIIENTPEIAKAIGIEMGLSMGQLRKAMLDGKLTSDRVFRAILDSAEKTNAEFKDMPKSIEIVTQALQNELAIAIKDIDKSLDFSASISRSISKFTEFVKEINAGVKAQKQIEEQQKRINDLLGKSTERPTSRRSRRTAREDTRSQEVKDADELNNLFDKNLEIQKKIDNVTTRGGSVRSANRKAAFMAEIEANNIRIEQLKKESEIAKEIADIRSGVDAAAAVEEEEVVAPIKLISKSDQARLDKLQLLGETERAEILRIEEERRAFILSQELLTEEARNNLLDKVSAERARKISDINNRLKEEEERKKSEDEQRQRERIQDLSQADRIAGQLAATRLGKNKKFAALQAGISLATNVAKATEVGFPQNIPFILGALAQGDQVLSLLSGGGRQFGGNVSPGLAHPINEAGVPEILNQGGKQFLLPTGQGGTISPLSGSGGGSQMPNVTIISSGTPQTSEGVQISRGEIAIMINDANRSTEKKINASLATGRGDSARSLQTGFRVNRNLR